MLLCNCAVALSNMCSCIFVSIEMSTVVLACAMEISRLYSAFFVSPLLLDTYPLWKVRNKEGPNRTPYSLLDAPLPIALLETLLVTHTVYTFILSQFFDQISYMKYGYIGLVLNEYHNLKFDCKPQSTVPECLTTTDGTYSASYMLIINGYDRYTIGYCAGCMIVYIAVCRITSYLALRFIKM